MRSPDPAAAALRRRLRPLHAAVFLQGFMLWVPVEKLFMTEIGFDAAAVGVMAAAYSALVPLLELPSGILADRWSRRGVLILSSVAIALGALLGGLSHERQHVRGLARCCSASTSPATPARWTRSCTTRCWRRPATAATSSGASAGSGRWRAVALVASALLGGWVAGLLGPRVTYFLTVPFALPRSPRTRCSGSRCCTGRPSRSRCAATSALTVRR